MASSDIIKIGFDYRASLEQFEKETNGVFDGISDKAGKQKITIQLDAKDDKVIDKIKELQKLKLDKFTFEFGDSGLKEQLQTFDKLENKINEIINLSKGIDLSFNTKNKTEAYNQLKKYADAFKDYYGNEEAMATNAGAKAGYAYYKAYEEALRKGVAQSKLEKVTVDFDVNDSIFSKERIVENRIKEFESFQKYGNADESNLIAEITSLENRLLKFNSAYSQVKANLGDAPITSEITKNIEEYVRLLEVAESRAKDAEIFGYSYEDINSDKDLANMYLDFAKEDAIAENKKYIESLKQEETQATTTTEAEQKLAETQKQTVSNTSNSNNSQIEELKSDIQEVKTELGDVKDRISSIESNSFENVREDVEKTKESVKELNSELTEMKSNLSSTPQGSNISSASTAEQYKQITADTVSVLSDVGKTEDQIISKIQQERKEAEKNNEVLREHLVLLDSAGKVVANHLGSTSNVNGTFSNEQLSQANGGKIIHTHPGKASFFGGKDLQNLFQNSMYDQIKQIELVWGDSSLSIDKSTLTKESSSTILNIMRNVRKTLTEVYGDNEGGMPSQEAREHINAIEKEIFKTISQKLNVSVSENGSMANEVTESLSDIDKAIIKRFQGIKSSVVQDIDASDIIKSQMKDAFPDQDVSASVESATNSIKEENNVLEQNTQKVKENTQAKERNANVNLDGYDKRLDSYNGKIDKYKTTIDRFNDGGWTSSTYLENVQAVKNAVKEYETLLNELKGKDANLVTSEDIAQLDKYEKKIKDTIATVTNMSASEKGYNFVSGQKELDKIHKLLNENSKMSSEAKNKIKAYYAEIESGNPSMSLDKIHGEILKIYNAEVEAGRAGKTLWDTLKNSGFHQIAAQMAGIFSLYDVINVGKQFASTVIDINTQITELAKVSEQSSKQIYTDFDSYADIAENVRGTISDTISATADWSKNGYSIPDAKQLAEISQLYKNVGDGIDIDEANESLISTLKGFQLEADQAEHIVDVFNEVSNNEAISSAGIGEALQRSAASFNAASTDLEKSVALVSATNSVLQDPDKVGNMWRTVSARLRGSETELKEMGEDTDGLVTSTSKLQALVKGITGFDIMKDKDTYKDIYDIVLGIGEKWQDLSDIDRASLLEALAGKQQSNALAAALSNIDILKKSYEEATNAEGSARKENEEYAKSIQASIDLAQAKLEKLSNDFLSSDFLKGLIDAGGKLIDVLDGIVKSGSAIPIVITTIVAILGKGKSTQRFCPIW